MVSARRSWSALALTCSAFMIMSGASQVAAYFMDNPEPTGRTAKMSVDLEGLYFSPNGGGEEAIVEALDKAQNSVRIAAYSFTSAPIIDAVIRARKRLFVVSVVLDKSHLKEKNGAAARFKAAGVDVKIDGKHSIQHSKYIIIDTQYLFSGSYNFTKSAKERNAENLLQLKSGELVKLYSADFKKHYDHAAPYTPSMTDKDFLEPESEE